MTYCLATDCKKEVFSKELCKQCYSKKYNKEYRIKHRDKLLKVSKEYYHKNKSALREYNKKYMEVNKEQVYEVGKIYRRTTKGRFNQSVNNAKSRGILWELTLEEFSQLIKNNCDYCNDPLPTASSGLDRKNNDLSYTLQNVVPCCYRCNTMKGKYLTYEEMKLIWNMRKSINGI